MIKKSDTRPLLSGFLHIILRLYQHQQLTTRWCPSTQNPRETPPQQAQTRDDVGRDDGSSRRHCMPQSFPSHNRPYYQSDNPTNAPMDQFDFSLSPSLTPPSQGGHAPASSSTTSHGNQTAPTQKFSCHQCRARKLKCDRVWPCQRCVQLGEQCQFAETRRRPGHVVKRPRVKELENRLSMLCTGMRIRDMDECEAECCCQWSWSTGLSNSKLNSKLQAHRPLLCRCLMRRMAPRSSPPAALSSCPHRSL